MKITPLIRSVFILGSVVLAASGCSTQPGLSTASPSSTPQADMKAAALPSPPNPWADMTAAAATGYCLASHPYQTIHPGVSANKKYPRGFTPDGYEIVPVPGVVGAVRRNYIYKRTITGKDEGVSNTCEHACREFGKGYEPTYQGTPLHQQVGAGGASVITSGIGDMASMAVSDKDFYLGTDAIVGMWSRGNTWHESDVAQADFCCCAVK